MTNDKMISIEEIVAGLKKAKAAIKKQPGLMKSSVGYLDMVSTYVDRIATAKEKGKWVASHGTQQPLEILEAMDVMGVFNEFWGVVSNIVRLESVPEALSVSASTGTPGEVCSFFRNMDGLMHAGKWPRSDFFLYASSVCDNVKSFHGPALWHPQLRPGAVLLPVHGSCDGTLEERVQAVDRLPGGADGKEAGLRPSEGDGASVLPSHRVTH
jgi:hypothetical protein